jgi:diguanylate cyclase (GGDEF)-like protein
MLWWNNHFKPWPIFAAMACCALVQPMRAVASAPSIETLLVQTENLRTANHPQFLRQLATLHQHIAGMSAYERWQLRYLDAWQASFQGDYANADTTLQDIIDHAGDPTLVTKASAMLMNNMGSTKRYTEAFELANRLVADLPKTQDKQARFRVLYYVAQLLRDAGQYDLAVDYVHEMMQTLPPGTTLCQPQTMLISVLYEDHKLTSSSADIQQGIDICRAAAQPVFSNAIWIVKVSLYLDENQPDKALALLDHIAPGIRANPNYYQTQDAQVQYAQAYWKLGEDSKARAAALAALAASHPDEVNETLRDAYEVLYRIAKKHGNATAALTYYEHYVTQNYAYLTDLSAGALAYDVSQQHVLAQKLETEKLSKQNNILRLQQALSAKMIETSRLSIVLLLVVLASVVFWLFRTKRSQLRFKQQARLDGLTGVLNHQHFISEAEHALHLLARKRDEACLVFIDLDHFKQINDTHGHAIGDAVLKHTIAICQQSLRAGDMLGRLGGEEFGILLVECPHTRGMAIADRIRMAIETAPVTIDEHVIAFSASIGLASTQTSGYGLQRLCRDADAALYRAKRTGRNRVISDAEEGDRAQTTG